jgi:4-hydroxybenzoate polyprenyltransferase
MNIKPLLKLLRLHQWVKNLLLFVPVVMAHRWQDSLTLSGAVGAFFSFSLIASAVYVINDIVDIEADRAHPKKKFRPLASGEITRTVGLFTVPFLLSLGFALALVIGTEFLGVVSCYFILTTLYSFQLKRIPIVDILTLASLYSIRIFAGAVACSVPISQWLLAFSMFLFFSLACVKRYDELLSLADENDLTFRRRGYRADDLSLISQFGITSGFLSILVLALYLNSADVTVLYSHAEHLWLLCPLFFYWVCRVWLKTKRGEMHEDPVVFALKDKASYFVGLILLIIVLSSL